MKKVVIELKNYPSSEEIKQVVNGGTQTLEALFSLSPIKLKSIHAPLKMLLVR